jgi:hypothetical protein
LSSFSSKVAILKNTTGRLVEFLSWLLLFKEMVPGNFGFFMVLRFIASYLKLTPHFFSPP